VRRRNSTHRESANSVRWEGYDRAWYVYTRNRIVRVTTACKVRIHTHVVTESQRKLSCAQKAD